MGTLYCQKAPSFGWDVKQRSWLSVIIKNPRMSFEKSRGVTSASWPNLPIGLWPWPPNHPHIYWLASSLCLLSTNKLVCGERSGALWLPSHHPGGCCTLVVDEETPPSHNVERFECLEMRYINVMNYYYYYYYIRTTLLWILKKKKFGILWRVTNNLVGYCWCKCICKLII